VSRKKVRVPKIQNARDSDFFFQKGGKKQKKFSGFLISVPYRSHTGKERKKKSCQEQSLALGILIFSELNSTNFLPRQ